MRTLPLVCSLLLAALPVVSPAAGPISEPHALVYFQARWSGQAQDTGSTVGLRLDRTAVVEDGVIEYQRLLQRPAALDFRLGREGVQMLSIAGTDYAELYRVHHADEAAGAAGPEEQPEVKAETTAEKSDAPAETKTGTAEEPAEEEEKKTISGILNKTPVGIIIGVGIGIVLVSGVGG